MPTVQLLHVPDCPLADRLRAVVRRCLDDAAISIPIEDREGPYPSPTLVVDGLDVTTGTEPAAYASCRLDLPSCTQILDALNGSSR